MLSCVTGMPQEVFQRLSKFMKLILFDLDNTLLNGDTQSEWGSYLASRGHLSLEEYRQRMSIFEQEYHQGRLNIQELMEYQIQILKRYPKEKLELWSEEFVEERIRPLIVEKGWKTVREHQAAGDELILITATNQFLTTPISRMLGIRHLIASREERDFNDNYTGRLFGVPSYKEGKVKRLQEWLQEQNRSLKDYEESWFYSDSHNDLPLLSIVSHPMIVNPDPLLRKHAEEKQWKIIDFGIIKK